MTYITCPKCKGEKKVWDPDLYAGGVAGCGTGGYDTCPDCLGLGQIPTPHPSRISVIRKSLAIAKELPDKTGAGVDLIEDFTHLLEIIDLMTPVVEYVSRGKGYVGVTRYPDAEARAAMGKLGD